MGAGLAEVAIAQVALAETFDGACLLWGRAEIAGDGQGLGVTFAGPRSVCCPRRQLAEAVESLGLAEQVAQITE
jgi:hypothetical protein